MSLREAAADGPMHARNVGQSWPSPSPSCRER